MTTTIMATTYTLTTTDLNKRTLRESRHTSAPSLYRYYVREQGRVHPEGRGAEKPWSGYVTIRRDDGMRMEFLGDGNMNGTPSLVEWD